jgi:Uma2 family endonuclease
MGTPESTLTMDLGKILGIFLDQHKLGFLTGPDGTLRLLPKLVRAPDIAFISWDRVPSRRRPREPVYDLVPDLAIEVLSKGNTKKEMKRKRREYFRVGVRRVWQIDLNTRTVEVFTAPTESTTLTEADTLDGGDVLPGLKLPVRQIFAEFPVEDDNPGPTKKPRKNGKKS